MASTTESVGGGGGEAGHPQGGAFVRRSSGLVRDVSPLKAMFFSMAAAFGGGIAFTFQNMTVTGQPMSTSAHGLRLGGDRRRRGVRVPRDPVRDPLPRDAAGGRELRLHLAHHLPVRRVGGVLELRRRLDRHLRGADSARAAHDHALRHRDGNRVSGLGSLGRSDRLVQHQRLAVRRRDSRDRPGVPLCGPARPACSSGRSPCWASSPWGRCSSW